MRGASLLLVFLVAKLAIVWGHSAPLTCLALLAYVWQDAMIALAFAALDISLEKMGATTRIAWAIYWAVAIDRKSTRLNSSHQIISYAVFCLKKKTISRRPDPRSS